MLSLWSTVQVCRKTIHRMTILKLLLVGGCELVAEHSVDNVF